MKLADVAPHVLFAPAMGLMVWLAKKPVRVDPFDGAKVLAYHWVFRILAWSCFLLFVGIGIGAVVFEQVANMREAVILGLFVLGFGGLGAYLILDSTSTRILLNDRSITISTA